MKTILTAVVFMAASVFPAAMEAADAGAHAVLIEKQARVGGMLHVSMASSLAPEWDGTHLYARG